MPTKTAPAPAATRSSPVYWVAGVGGGLGTAVASTIASRGGAVVALARTPANLERFGEEAKRRGWTFKSIQADLKSPIDVERAKDSTFTTFRRLDGVAALAGRWVPGATRIDEMSPAEWRAGLEDNLDPIYSILHAVVPAMAAQGHGSIVLIGAAEEVRRLGSASYAAAKSGVGELARKLAGDYRAQGIRINAVLPGNMEKVESIVESPVSGAIALDDHTPSSSWEVARAIHFLLSDESRWITGTTLTVDGGFSLRPSA